MVRWYFYPVGSDNYLVVVAAALALLLLLGLGRRGRRRQKAAAGPCGDPVPRHRDGHSGHAPPTLVTMETRKQSATLVFLAGQSREA